MTRIRREGGRAEHVEADLAGADTVGGLFDRAEAAFGPVEILVNNASGWLADTFLPYARDRFGRALRPVDADSHDRQFAVDVRAPALLIAEFARRHVRRGATWGRIIGLTSGGPAGFPEEVSYGAAKAAQENYTMSAAAELGRYGITANMLRRAAARNMGTARKSMSRARPACSTVQPSACPRMTAPAAYAPGRPGRGRPCRLDNRPTPKRGGTPRRGRLSPPARMARCEGARGGPGRDQIRTPSLRDGRGGPREARRSRPRGTAWAPGR